jgi:hypothetical protein
MAMRDIELEEYVGVLKGYSRQELTDRQNVVVIQ